MYRNVLLALFSCFSATCTQAKEPAVREPAPLVEDAAASADARPKAPSASTENDAGSAPSSPLDSGTMADMSILGLTLRPGDSACVLIDGTQEPCYEKLEDVFEAVPDLGERARKSQQATLELAQIVHAFKRHSVSNSGRVNVEFRLVTSTEEAKEIFKEWLAKPKVAELSRWRADTKSNIPNIESISAPHWKGKRFFATSLILERGRKEIEFNKPESESYLSIRASEHQVDFTATPRYEYKVLPTKTHSLAAHATAVAQFFGGQVDAFVRVPFDGKHLLVAIGPKKKAKRYVVQEGSEVQAFASWPEVIAVYPDAGSSRTLADLTNAIFWYFTYRSSQRHAIITDAAAYKKRYKEEGLHEEKLRYWHDEFRHTVWDVPKLDMISDPSVKDGKLVVFSTVDGDGREPMRLVVDLANLQANSKVEVTPMYRRRVLQDTGKAPGAGLHPLPAPPEPAR